MNAWTLLTALLSIGQEVGLQAPEIRFEDDGDLCVDWDLARGATVSVSFSSAGRVAFAALVVAEGERAGGKSQHGTATGVLPDGISDALRALAKRIA